MIFVAHKSVAYSMKICMNTQNALILVHRARRVWKVNALQTKDTAVTWQMTSFQDPSLLDFMQFWKKGGKSYVPTMNMNIFLFKLKNLL